VPVPPGPSDLLLGVDAGQTVTKACVFDRSGRELGSGSARVGVHSPEPHWVERDMDEVWRASTTAIRRALDDAETPGDRIAAVGIVGHNDGVYLVDERSSPVRAAVTAMDTRGRAVLGEWRRSAVWPEALALTGQTPYAGSPSTLLAWFARHQPDVLERTRWVLFCKDWIRLRLTGEVATDPTEASAAFTAVRTQRYADETLGLYGIEEVGGKLPPILASHAVAGEVVGAAAEETGLRTGTPVVTGAHDVDGIAVGSGVVRPEVLSLAAGTFSINQVVSCGAVVDERWQARSFVEPGTWLCMSTSPSSATNLEWWRGIVGLPADASSYAALEREAASALDGPSQLIYHPFLYGSPYGEAASAGVFGLRGWHGRGDLVRAVLEGVVLGHRVHVDALRERFRIAGAARLSGGAARSVVWSQMFADALDLDVEVPACEETGARGAALLAALGIGWYSSLEETAETLAVARRHQPGPARREVLNDAYDRFLDLTASLRDVWPDLG
jgi:L-xylulokinase